MTLFASVRMAGRLNDMINNDLAGGAAAAAVVGSDVAHHVVDPDGLLGLDPLRAVPLSASIDALAEREPERWVLVLPTPGRLGPLRGPTPLNRAAIEARAAVVGLRAGLAVVPLRVGPALQWRVFAAERPGLPPTPYEAERALSETVLSAGTALTRLDVGGGGRRPTEPTEPLLGNGSHQRQQAAAARAARLLVACSAALTDDGGSLSSFEAEARARQLRAVRDAAADALCAAATFGVSRSAS